MSANRFNDTKPAKFAKSRRIKRVSAHLTRWARVTRLVTWVQREYFPSAKGFQSPFYIFIRKTFNILRCEGVKSLIEYVRSARVEYLQYLGAESQSERRIWAKRLKRRWGRGPRNEVVLKTENTDIIRLVLTVLTCTRCFTLPVKMDISSIVAPSRATLD